MKTKFSNFQGSSYNLRGIKPRGPINKKSSPHLERSPVEIKASSRSPDSKRKDRIYPRLEDLSDDDDDERSQSRETTLSPEKQKGFDDRRRTPHPDSHFHGNKQTDKEKSSQNLFKIVIAAIVVLLAIGVAFTLSNSSKSSPVESSIDCSEFLNLTVKYSNQDKKLFKALKAGIEGMYRRKPQVPSVVTFYSTDEKAIKTILADVVEIAKKCINKNRDPILLTSSDLNAQKYFDDNRRIISEFKNKLEDRTIMIITDVDKISSEVVGGLHSFADTHNPLVSESILYLTVKVPEKPEDLTNSYIFNYLKSQWKDLASHIRDPLITRFVDQTFYINSA